MSKAVISFVFSLLICARLQGQVSVWENVGPYLLLYPGMQYNTPVPETGRSDLWEKEFAEKYTNNSLVYVLGVAIQNWGEGTGNDSISFGIYDVGSNGLPGNQLYSKRIHTACMDFAGGVNYVIFDAPIAMPDTFFVSVMLGAYWLATAYNDFNVLNCGGCRLASDTFLYGRNAVRMTDDVWYDLRYAKRLRTHLALYPIVSSSATAAVPYADVSDCVWSTLDKVDDQIVHIYPNPATSVWNLELNDVNQAADIYIYDSYGRQVQQRKAITMPGTMVIDITAFNPGLYSILIQGAEGWFLKKAMKQ